MTTEQPSPGNARPPLRRIRRDGVLGGVCAGVARHLGVDVAVIRLAALVVGVVSAGAAVLVYVIAWITLPEAAESGTRPERPPRPAVAGEPREAWNAVAGQLKALAADFRTAGPVPPADQTAETAPSGPVVAVDSAMTSLGQRLRDPQVQAGARQAATGLSTAITASVNKLGRQTGAVERRGSPATDSGLIGQDGTADQ